MMKEEILCEVFLMNTFHSRKNSAALVLLSTAPLCCFHDKGSLASSHFQLFEQHEGIKMKLFLAKKCLFPGDRFQYDAGCEIK